MTTSELTGEQLRHLFPYSFRERNPPLGRNLSGLPRVRGARIEHGIEIEDGEELRLVFESTNSDWNQGIHLETDKTVQVDGTTYRRGTVVFYDSDHRELRIVVRSREGMLWIWNVWDFRPNEVTKPPGSIISHMNYSGMLVEELPVGYRYRCNEGRDDDDYDDLIFRIERTGRIELPRPGRKDSGEHDGIAAKTSP